MRIRQVGRHALLVELADLEQTRAWYDDLVARRERAELDAEDVVPGARTVLLDGVRDPAAVASRLRTWPPPTSAGGPGRGLVAIAVRYDGADLAEVAELWGVPPAEVAATHAAHEFTVAFCGFAPGFAYLTGLPEPLHVPRRATPRTSVPAGSVALAGQYCGVYPSASPGGWRLIGRTEMTLFDLDRDPPAVLTPGTRVRFVPEPT